MPNMVKRSVRLIAVIRAKLQKDRVGNLIEAQLEDRGVNPLDEAVRLQKDRVGNLIEAQLEDLGVNPLDEAVRIDIDLTEIKVSFFEGNRPILEDDVKDE